MRPGVFSNAMSETFDDEREAPAGDLDFEKLLVRTSRTFALSIPRLPEPTRREVTVAYLLFRIADTFEDAASMPGAERAEALARFSRLLGEPPEVAAPLAALAAVEWSTTVPCAEPGYRELLARLPEVLDAAWSLAPAASELVRDAAQRTADGMIRFVSRMDAGGEVELEDLDDLRAYCYVVAGLVGELCTDLFALQRPSLAPLLPQLKRRAPLFGEGLQLVNILKDSAGDAQEGRRFLPASVPRDEVFGLAREDLGVAGEYVRLLQQADAGRGLVAFNALPARLALATLDRLEADGAGAKLSRPEVLKIIARLEHDLDTGASAVPAPDAHELALVASPWSS